MNKSVRYALIGVTGIGGYYLAAIPELEQEGQARLVAVADPLQRINTTVFV